MYRSIEPYILAFYEPVTNQPYVLIAWLMHHVTEADTELATFFFAMDGGRHNFVGAYWCIFDRDSENTHCYRSGW
jgi:hypothetical protein